MVDIPILLLGGSGQVGWELRRSLVPLGPIRSPTRDELDLFNAGDLCRYVGELRPSLIVNAAAYTDVESAETEVREAHLLNADIPAVLAEKSRELDALFIHFSTDYVFDGNKSGPYVEDDETSPLNVYGQSKLSGENRIAEQEGKYLIFRTSWVYSARRKNFLRTMIRLAQNRREISVVADQIGAPTWARAIAEATSCIVSQILARDAAPDFRPGTYHMTAAGSTSWHGFAQEIGHRLAAGVSAFQPPEFIPIAAADFATQAARPANSVLDNARMKEVFGVALPHWKEQLALCLDELDPLR